MSLEAWRVDGTALESYARVLESRDGLDSTPPLLGDDLDVPGRHGALHRRKRYGPASKVLALVVDGTLPDGTVPSAGTAARAQYDDNLDALLRLLRPGLRHVERDLSDGSTRECYAEPRGPFEPVALGQHGARVAVELVLPGAFWQDTADTVAALAAVGAGLELAEFAGSTAPTVDALVAITGPVNDPGVVDAATGLGFSYTGNVAGGATLLVDAAAHTAVIGAANVLGNLTHTGARLFELSASPIFTGPLVDVTGAGTGPGFGVTVTGRRRYLR